MDLYEPRQQETEGHLKSGNLDIKRRALLACRRRLYAGMAFHKRHYGDLSVSF
jgi:hypothetical protein